MKEEEKISSHHAHGFVAKISWWNKIKHFNFHSFFATASYGRTIVLLGIFLIILALPVTVIFLGQRTQTQQHAYLQCDPISSHQCGGSSPIKCPTSIAYSNYVAVTQNAGQRCGNTVCSSLGQVPGKCGVPAKCAALGAQCGVNSDCCGGYSGGTTYCSRTGKCTNYCTQSLGHDCVNDYYCSAYFNYHGICASTSTFDCKHVNGYCGYKDPSLCANTSGASCQKYQCAAGQVAIQKTCTNGADFVCCKAGTPTYTCSDSNTFKGTDGSVVNCASGLYCAIPSAGIQDSIGWQDVQKNYCKPASALCKATYRPDTHGNPLTTEECQSSTFISQYSSGCPDPKGYTAQRIVGSDGVPTGQFQCVYKATTVTQPPSVCSTNIGACEKYQCGAGEKIAKSSSGSTYSCAQGGEFVCCAKAPTNSPPTYYCSPNNSNDTTGTTIKGDDGSVTNCDTGKYCLSKDSYSTMKGWADAKVHLCTYTSSNPTCTSLNGKCQAAQSVCGSGYKNESSLDKTCGYVSICCIPNGSSNGGGGSGGGNTCTNGKSTSFATEMKLPGIGSGAFENQSPKHTTRQTTVTVKDTNGKTIWTQAAFSTKLSFTSAKKLRVGTIGLGTGLVCSNTYFVYVKVPGYVTMKKQITYGNTTQTLDVTESEIIPGDLVSEGTNNVVTPDGKLAGDDKVTIADYNIIRTCHNVDPSTTIDFQNGSQTVHLKCSDLMNLLDYPDGGTQGDEWAFNYNLWLRGYIKYQGH